jgi:hypothetical protein
MRPVKLGLGLVRAYAARFLIDVGGVGGSVLMVAVHRSLLTERRLMGEQRACCLCTIYFVEEVSAVTPCASRMVLLR